MTGKGNNIISLFLAAAEQHAEKAALVYNGRHISYATLLQQVMHTAQAYKAKGIQKGDKVMVFVPMSPELYRIVLALFYIGACPVFLDEWVSVARLKVCCNHVPCRAMIAGGKLSIAAWFIPVLRKIPIKIKPGLIADTAINEPPTTVSGNDTALITFTTGTTGIPKAANRTHDFLRAQYTALEPLIQNNAAASMVTLPIVVLVNLGIGKTTLLPPGGGAVKKKETTGMLVDDMITSKADEIICSPSVLLNVVKLVDEYPEFTESIRYIFTGGGAVYPNEAKEISTTFPEATSTVVYGSTEAEPISHIDMKQLADVSSEYIQQHGLPVGHIDKHTTCAIIPITDQAAGPYTGGEFQQLRLPANTVGEIVVTGGHVLKDYVNNEAAIARNKILVDGQVWHRTGDSGMMNEAGALHLYGPCKEIIEHNGSMYYPLVCTYLFTTMTHAKHAALLKGKDKLILIVETATPIADDVLQHVLKQLQLDNARIVYMQHIPRDKRHHTKTDYETLRNMLQV